MGNLTLVSHILEPIGDDQMSDLSLRLYVKFQRLMSEEQGQDLSSMCLIALAAISGVNHVATATTKVFSNISSSLA